MDEKEKEINKGLEGVVVAATKICFIDGIKGKLYYRGYRIEDLAEGCSYEEVAYLLLYEKLPNKRELEQFSSELKKLRHLPAHVVKLIETLGKGMNSMEALRTVVSALAYNDPDVRKVSRADHLRNGASLVAKMPTIVAYHYRISKGKKIIEPDPKLGHAANFLYMLEGDEPDPTSAKGMDMDFVLHAEHSFNASSFAVRVTVSTLSDMHSAFTTGIGTLKGPLHGGAAQEVMHMLEEIKEPKNVDAYVKETLEKHGKIMGYGHRIYKTYDPRARILKKMAEKMSKEKDNMRWFQIGQRLESVMAKSKNIYPNVDFYSAMVYHNLGLPVEMDSPIFAIARSSGWVAHAVEQYEDNKLIRPVDVYTGPLDLKFVPLERRR